MQRTLKKESSFPNPPIDIAGGVTYKYTNDRDNNHVYTVANSPVDMAFYRALGAMGEVIHALYNASHRYMSGVSLRHRYDVSPSRRALTWGELKRLGYTAYGAPDASGKQVPVPSLPPTHPVPDTTLPPRPTDLTATPIVNTVQLHWGGYLFDDPYYSYTEVWRGPTNDLEDAVFLSAVKGVLFLDNSITDNENYFYWVRNTSPGGFFSQFNATLGVVVQLGDTAISNIDHLVSLVNAQQESGSQILTMSDSLFGIESVAETGEATYPFVIATVDGVSKIALNAETFIPDAVIDSVNITEGAITNAKIGEAIISRAKIENLAVTEAKISNAAITSAKIGNLAVDSIHLNGDKIIVPYVSAIPLFEWPDPPNSVYVPEYAYTRQRPDSYKATQVYVGEHKQGLTIIASWVWQGWEGYCGLQTAYMPSSLSSVGSSTGGVAYWLEFLPFGLADTFENRVLVEDWGTINLVSDGSNDLTGGLISHFWGRTTNATNTDMDLYGYAVGPMTIYHQVLPENSQRGYYSLWVNNRGRVRGQMSGLILMAMGTTK